MAAIRTRGERAFDAANLLVLAAIGLACAYPFAYVLALSLSSAGSASALGLRPWPLEFSLVSYRMVLGNPEILTGYANTVGRTLAGTVLVLLATALTAYPLARRDLPHRRKLIVFVLVTMLFSGGIVPSYLLVKNLGLMDNRLVYVLPGLVSGFNVIVMRNFFLAVPESLGESARIDGAGEWRILFSIYLPLSKPVLATVGLWTAVAHWNAWFDALLYINSDDRQVLQTFLRRVVIGSNTELLERGLPGADLLAFTPETVKAATIMVTMVPILLLYPFLQRYFVKGVMLGGVKE